MKATIGKVKCPALADRDRAVDAAMPPVLAPSAARDRRWNPLTLFHHEAPPSPTPSPYQAHVPLPDISEFRWTNRKNQTVVGVRYSIMIDGTLRIDDVDTDDSGVYTCEIATPTMTARENVEVFGLFRMQ